ncbi:hypothetical protein HPTD01_1392 [Halomonas sp. TD01]|nr:hypothetical protein HPTD01_1392 [Halomonas sp. TD01]
MEVNLLNFDFQVNESSILTDVFVWLQALINDCVCKLDS